MRNTIILLIAVACLAGGAYALYGGGNATPQARPGGGARPGIPVEMAVVQTRPFVEQEIAIGSLASDESVIIRSEIAGRIDRIAFEEGQRIARGELLVTIDDSIYRAEFDQAEARLNLSRANYDRALDLQKRGAGTQRALDEAASKLQEDRATLDLARARLERTEIQTPFAGVIGIRRVSPGDYIMAGQEIVNLEAIDPIKVNFGLPEMLLSAVSEGQSINVSVDAFPGEVFSGEVYAINPRIDAAGRNVELRARIANPDGRLRPGLFARVAIIFSRQDDAVMIPERALVPVQGRQTVFVVEDGKAVSRAIETGGRDDDMVQVMSGLSAGETIITGGQLKVREGMPVADADKLTGAGA